MHDSVECAKETFVTSCVLEAISSHFVSLMRSADNADCHGNIPTAF